ncbi:RagB/SusD family nutrient uptake outer membrane protein [Proteiniphilum acetatigenes]|uniref:RagB/SusD family nutrient uptake outer membrane protein n=1 Tax=Proteiniphilum acetatigenes TaxID=294710 RepID=UPI00037026EE|nr:RagB/SusD family nutrient uptake outer membrane protein [Proteiniphilum acetatigenes]SFL57945.1 Starch-binding associating with outer membrane [Porphyromonadaceae bacterium KH3CP3RA]
MKNSTIFIIAALSGFLALTSCEDFLTHDNTTNANQETFFDSDKAVAAATAPLYNYVWYSFNEKFYYGMGDGRANNITARWSPYIYPYTNFTETALSEGLEEAWGSLYSVVAQSNYTINNIRQYSGPQVSEAAKVQAYAEARFMRGLAYWYIGSLWGKGIIYENTAEMVNNSVVPAHRGVDVIEFAIRDLEYAAANLSRTASNEGRVTCYSAYGILSRVYLSMAGLTSEGEYNGNNIATDFNRGTRNPYYLDLARRAALKAIEEGPYSLLGNYGDLFAVSTTNNNSESVFQLQWLQGSTDAIGWGANNPMPAFFSWSTMVGETNWGNATYASYDLVQAYDKQDRIRRHYTIATVGEEYPDLNVKNGGYIYNETESGYEGKCNIKKYVIGKIDDNGQSYQQSSGLNTYMMRLAEVYLNLAEAILGNNAVTTDATALTYVNLIRGRAGMPALGSITYEDLRYERRIELALEGQYWYDLVRRAYYRQQEVVNYLNNQDRNAGYEWDETEESQYAKTGEGTGVAVATAANLVLPISDVDRGRNPLLNNDPVAFEFGEKEVTVSDLFN